MSSDEPVLLRDLLGVIASAEFRDRVLVHGGSENLYLLTAIDVDPAVRSLLHLLRTGVPDRQSLLGYLANLCERVISSSEEDLSFGVAGSTTIDRNDISLLAYLRVLHYAQLAEAQKIAHALMRSPAKDRFPRTQSVVRESGELLRADPAIHDRSSGSSASAVDVTSCAVQLAALLDKMTSPDVNPHPTEMRFITAAAELMRYWRYLPEKRSEFELACWRAISLARTDVR